MLDQANNMIILSHRGCWQKAEDKNSRKAFERSFSIGVGTETDVRDHNSRLVISHDMPSSDCMMLEDFFDLYKGYQSSLHLALNIKSDGLQTELARLLSDFDIENYFVFDMAVPDGLLYLKQKFRTFTRQSEYESPPAYYELAQGIWLDEFNGHWICDDVIEQHLEQSKALCIVSPELHKRDHWQEWQHYKQLENRIGKNRIMLCTDFPEKAGEYFNE
jgi:glycerophosphoryl diester phosphodiesterase